MATFDSDASKTATDKNARSLLAMDMHGLERPLNGESEAPATKGTLKAALNSVMQALQASIRARSASLYPSVIEPF